MGRSSQHKARENRAKIVETACAMFRESGVENVSVAQVMAANGMTVGGFYKQFESRDALIAEAFALAFEQSGQTWKNVFARADTKAEPRAATLVRQYLRNSTAKQRCPLLAFAVPVATGAVDGTCADAYREGSQGLFEVFVEQMPAGQEQQAKVLFAAMLGARLLAQAAGDAPWVKAVEAAVNQAASA
ncbi:MULTISPECIES: TetR/AcrR family transcriptional regulator [unclassified Pseudomonas]|uniref:TetR/AcrR family transcriptional regulator n=1 Tax=unclassified Pseudomonas TaxID=196821 RepID=UPI0035C047FC